MRRVSFWFLCLVPVLAIVLVVVRDLRDRGLHHIIGVFTFAAIGAAVWRLAASALRRGTDEGRLSALAGIFLIAPFALVSLLWVGIATPADATPPENLLRYLVLLGGAIAVTCGVVSLKDVLNRAGERVFASLGFGTGLLAGASYVVWLTFQIGLWSARIRHGKTADVYIALNDSLDSLLFIACILTYLSTAALVMSFGVARWIGRGACTAFLLLTGCAIVFLLIRGLSFPDASSGLTPWYVQPGFIAGIPAVPWIVPHLLGVIVLRRAGSEAT